MRQERSRGAVVFRKRKGELEILLIQHKNGGHWAFPKGHVEKGETDRETALREIREETGLKVKLDTDFRTSVTYSPKPEVVKEVAYFAAKAEKGAKVRRQKEEVTDFAWLPPSQAMERVTFENDKRILAEFLAYREEKAARKKAEKERKKREKE